MDGIFHELLQRAAQGQVPELQERPSIMGRPSTDAPMPVTPLDPHLVGLLGGLADTASTYNFLRRGTGREDNAVVAGLSEHPGAMAVLGVGATLGKYGLAKLLGRKFPTLAKILDANVGALQAGYAGHNLMAEKGTSSREQYARQTQPMLVR